MPTKKISTELDICFAVPTVHPEIEKVIYNNPATIVIWDDGSKTVVRCQDGDTFDKRIGLAMAICKKFFGNKSKYNEVLKKWADDFKLLSEAADEIGSVLTPEEARRAEKVAPHKGGVKKQIRTRKGIDHGRIVALYTANPPRSVSWIADDLGCSVQTVINHLKAEGIYRGRK